MWELDHKKRLNAEELILLNCGAGDNSCESFVLQGDQASLSLRKSVLDIHWKDWCWSWSSNTLASWCELTKLPKELDAGKDWRQEEKGKTEDEMVRWHHQFDGHEFERFPGDGEGQGSLACCSPWGLKESDTTEWLNNNNKRYWNHTESLLLSLWNDRNIRNQYQKIFENNSHIFKSNVTFTKRDLWLSHWKPQ